MQHPLSQPRKTVGNRRPSAVGTSPRIWVQDDDALIRPILHNNFVMTYCGQDIQNTFTLQLHTLVSGVRVRVHLLRFHTGSPRL